MNVFLTDEQSVPVDVARIRTLAELVLEQQGFPQDTEVTIMLVTDSDMVGYNERFMNRDGPTDVLAFPLEELAPGVVPDWRPGDPPVNLGDVIIAPEYVGRQASEQGSEFTHEISLMVVHGILHLMGWDHGEDSDAERMEGRERELLGMIGVPRT